MLKELEKMSVNNISSMMNSSSSVNSNRTGTTQRQLPLFEQDDYEKQMRQVDVITDRAFSNSNNY